MELRYLRPQWRGELPQAQPAESLSCCSDGAQSPCRRTDRAARLQLRTRYLTNARRRRRCIQPIAITPRAAATQVVGSGTGVKVAPTMSFFMMLALAPLLPLAGTNVSRKVMLAALSSRLIALKSQVSFGTLALVNDFVPNVVNVLPPSRL